MSSTSTSPRSDLPRGIATRASSISRYVDEHGLAKTWVSLLVKQVQASKCVDRVDIENDLILKRAFDPTVEDLLTGLSQVEVGILYEFALAHKSHEARTDQGQFYTPEDISEVMVRLSEPNENHIWLDPCCGSGNLSYALAKSQTKRSDFLKRRLILVDTDELALLTAAVQLTVRLAPKSRGVYKALRSRSHQGDYLLREKGAETFVIMNPPYVNNASRPNFESWKARDLYAYFMEKVAKDVGNFVSITPQSFTNSHKFEGLRKVLLRELDSLAIVCFDNVPDNVFRGIKFGSTNTNKVNSTRAAITIGRRDNSPKTSQTELRITPLLRWRSSERSQLLSNVESHLSRVDCLKPGPFPKLRKDQSKLYEKLLNSRKTLHDLLGGDGSFTLHVPTTPRYFISATKRELHRASVRHLSFIDEESMNLAYLLLNSELFYWWWRVVDGGMSISLETLHRFPLPDELEVENALIDALVESEEDSLVTKMNHGMLTENIKHSDSLVTKLTQWALQGDAEVIRGVRSNSVL